MIQIFKILFILIIVCIIIPINCTSKSNSKWEIIKTFKSLSDVISNNSTSGLYMGFLNEKIGFAINKGNHVYYSSDSGEKWRETIVDTNPCLSGMEIFDVNNIVIGCQCRPIEYSNDSAKTWEKIGESSYSIFGFYNNSSGMIAQAVGSRNIKLLENFKIVKDIKLPKGLKNNTVAVISCLSNNDSYILTSGFGPLLRTRDGGETWEKINLEKIKDKLVFEPGITSMRFTDINNGIIIAYYYKNSAWISLTTNNGGKSWKYGELLKVSNQGLRSYLSKDSNYLTIINSYDDESPVLLLQRKI